jgi:hypothetical protein
MHVAASAVVGAGGAFVAVVWEGGGATAAVVGTLRTDGDGLADGVVLVGAAGTAVVDVATAGAAGGAAVVALVLCETPTWA